MVGQRLGSAVVWPWRLGLVKSKTMAEEREREVVTKEREKQLQNNVSLFLKVVGKKKKKKTKQNKRRDLTPFGWVCLISHVANF